MVNIQIVALLALGSVSLSSSSLLSGLPDSGGNPSLISEDVDIDGIVEENIEILPSEKVQNIDTSGFEKMCYKIIRSWKGSDPKAVAVAKQRVKKAVSDCKSGKLSSDKKFMGWMYGQGLPVVIDLIGGVIKNDFATTCKRELRNVRCTSFASLDIFDIPIIKLFESCDDYQTCTEDGQYSKTYWDTIKICQKYFQGKGKGKEMAGKLKKISGKCDDKYNELIQLDIDILGILGSRKYSNKASSILGFDISFIATILEGITPGWGSEYINGMIALVNPFASCYKFKELNSVPMMKACGCYPKKNWDSNEDEEGNKGKSKKSKHQNKNKPNDDEDCEDADEDSNKDKHPKSPKKLNPKKIKSSDESECDDD